ncbi:lipoyl amidotransferase LIPT1, mitochondrial-like [Glossina fuscipes fuscipes]
MHPNAYHHCTLLVNANKTHLGDSLVREEATYTGKATASKKSAIKNLCDVNSTVNIAQLLSAIGYEFLRTSATELEDGDNIQTIKQRGFQLIKSGFQELMFCVMNLVLGNGSLEKRLPLALKKN